MNPAPTQPSFEMLSPGAVTPPKEIDFDIRRSVRMHRTLTVVVFLFVVLILLLFAFSRKPLYDAQSLIYVQPMKSRAITDTTEGVYDPSRYETYINQQLQTIVRADVLAEALSKPAARGWRIHGEPEQAAIARLQHSIKVERVEQSYELSIGIAGSDPVASADIVNAVTNAYIRAERADELAQSDQQLQILQEELQRISTDLAADRHQQAILSVTLGVADTTGESGNPYDVQLAELRSQLAKAQAEHDVAAAQYASVSGGDAAPSLRAAAAEIAASDPGLGALKQTIGARRSVIASQMAGLTPKNPIYQQDLDELARLDASIVSMEGEVRNKAAHQLQQKLDLENHRTQDIVDRLSAQLARKTSVATGATPELQHAADVAAEITRLQARYNELAGAINSIELQKDTSGLVHILVPAVPPLSAKTSIKHLVLLIAIPFGFIMAIFAAVLRSKFDPKIYIEKDVADALGFYPMATLPDTDEVDKIGKDEFILRLLAGIDQIHRADGAKSFVFTAASSQSSVSDLVGSLSRKMARLGYRVATIKSSELIESHEVSSGFFKAGSPGMPPARRAGSTRENFVVDKIEEFKRDVDYLFIDALPLLSSSEAEFAARLSDVVILVAESGETTRIELKRAFSLVKRLRIPGTAAVLSQVSLDDADVAFIDSVRQVELRGQAA